MSVVPRILALSVALAGCGSARSPLGDSPNSKLPTQLSNVTRNDFAGSRACQSCHAEIYAKWQGSPMHRMTRRMARGQARAPFDGARFRFMDDVASMVTQAGQHYMHLESSKYSSGWFRVTKVIGGRYREDYAGVQVAAPDPAAPGSGDERILPASYLLFNGEWRYKGYSVMSPERDGLKLGMKWKTSCSFCHNTAPWLSHYYDELYGLGAPSYQGAASLELPSERRLHYRISDQKGFEHEIQRELELLTGERSNETGTRELLEAVSGATYAHFSEEHLVELGIGCEACHGGARAHVADPARVRPAYTPGASFLETTTSQGQPVPRALAISHGCAKCHTVLFSRYPYTWEGGDRGFSPGGSNINSGEARNFLLGACTAELGCTSCHDPHAEDDAHALERLGTPAGNGVCTSCHGAYRDQRMLQRHTHHDPNGAGSACLACHMPTKNIGLDYALTRYHRIGAPNDSARVERDRPLECALCHADKSVLELVSHMESWWKKDYDRGLLQELYGKDLRVNVLDATLRRGKPHEQVVASFVAGQQKLTQHRDLIIEQLGHDIPLLRFYAHGALERISGRELALDMHLPGARLQAAARRALASQQDTATAEDRAPDAAP